MRFRLGVKTDMIENRHSFEWLFDLLDAEDVRSVQLGSFFELYQLPDEYFHHLRGLAEARRVRVESLFTAHRELGGFFRDDGPGWEKVARRNYERLIEAGALLGASRVGSNPGAVLRDRMDRKDRGLRIYLGHMKELMEFARPRGVEWLTVEPMSCLAEPPTLPGEMADMARELEDWRRRSPGSRSRAGFCLDIAHGYADASGRVAHDHMALLDAALPWTCELHLKNTDARYDATFGFTGAERAKGIIDVPAVRRRLDGRAAELPVTDLTGFLEIGGPKLGRDYSDRQLGDSLRESLRYLRRAWTGGAVSEDPPVGPAAAAAPPARPAPEAPAASRAPGTRPPVRVAPSLMCADLGHLADDLARLRAAGADMWHFDVMDFHFAPNLPMGLATLEAVRSATDLPVDVHLMVDDNDAFIPLAARLGASLVSAHAESARHLDRTLALIRDHGMKAGAALNPATPPEALEFVLERLDFVLLMTVNPGFAGQKLCPSALDKIARTRAWLDARRSAAAIEVDGNVSFENIPGMVAAGADWLVAGSSSVFRAGAGAEANFALTREAIARGLAMAGRTAGAGGP